MRWTKRPNGYISGPYFIRKMEGWRPSTPRRNWIWETHGPGVPVLAAYHTLREAKAACEEAAAQS